MAARYRVLQYLSAFLICLFSIASVAAQVRAIKGNKLLIELDGSQFQRGDIVKIKDSSGHVRALAKITKVAGRFAEGFFKGRPMKGYLVELFPHDQFERWRAAVRRRHAMKKHSGNYASHTSTPIGTTSYGGMIGLNSSSAAVTLVNSSNRKVSLSGSGFSAMGFMDHQLLSWFSFRGEAGLDEFNTSGPTDATSCNGTCTAKITYLSADMLGRFTKKSLWGGAGVDLLFPITKSSTALSSSSISTVTAYVLAAGYDFHFQGKGNPYIPIELQYQMFPSSSTVTANEIEFRIGYGKTF